MPWGGEFSMRSPGEGPLTFSVDLAGDLSTASGEYLTSATTALTVYRGTDATASALLIGSAQIVASLQPAIIALGAPAWLTVVAQQIGANVAKPAGFLASTVYQWSVTATTNLGNTLIWTQSIPVGAV